MGGRAAAVIAVLLLSSAIPSYADTIDLPSPQSEQLSGSELFEALGAPRDRLPASTVPGTVTNDELIQVAAAGDGSIQQVRDQQRIRLTGQGDYHIREAGPARSASALSDEPPVLDFGDIVWQGFCPGKRQLDAELILDPQIESTHLPLRVTLSFAAAGRRPVALVNAARVPAAGTITITITNTTRQPTVLPTADDAPARLVAAALDTALSAAHDPTAPRLPTNRTTLPTDLRVTGATTRRATQIVPLRLRGALRLAAATHPATGAGFSAPDAVRLDTMLNDTTSFTLASHGAGTLELDLTAVPVLDPRPLTPPHGFRSWTAWATAGPTHAERRAALDLLVQTAATGARASAYSPYLGPELGPAGSTVFHYVLARAEAPVAPTPPLKPRSVPIALTMMGALMLAGAAVVVWRRS
jgi:hypothetical protein